MSDRRSPAAIDPEDCGCLDCSTGYSVPLERATPAQVWQARLGVLTDRTNSGELPALTDGELLAVRATLDLVRHRLDAARQPSWVVSDVEDFLASQLGTDDVRSIL